MFRLAGTTTRTSSGLLGLAKNYKPRFSSQGPLQHFDQLVEEGRLRSDAEQRRAAGQLHQLYLSLLDYNFEPPHALYEYDLWNSQSIFGNNTAPKGVYLHGEVGTGKSMLMDLFFATCPVKEKRRVHFHQFMLEAHQKMHEIREAEKSSDRSPRDPKSIRRSFRRAKDPIIAPLASALMKDAWLLCFDEFQVNDIADAMILQRVFGRMFQMGLVVVATSNCAPDDLYKNGLQRQLFEPFIQTLKERSHVHHITSTTDYRALSFAESKGASANASATPTDAQAQTTSQEPKSESPSENSEAEEEFVSPGGVYFCPSSNPAAREKFEKLFIEEAKNASEMDPSLSRFFDMSDCRRALVPVMMGRTLRVDTAHGPVAKLSFHELCAYALGAADYQALCKRFHTVFIEDVPLLTQDSRDQARRFITLVDEMYEHKVKAVILADRPPNSLFSGKYTEQLAMERQELAEDLNIDISLPHQDAPAPSTPLSKKGLDENLHDPDYKIPTQDLREGMKVVGTGGSSGRMTTFIGGVEWSATGIKGASLASLFSGADEVFASRRAISRLLEMQSDSYLKQHEARKYKSVVVFDN